MRKTLLAAVALAPLCLVLDQTPANAQTDITSNVSAPVQTATADNGSPGDVTIESGGSVTVSGTTPAVTVNSSNNVTNDGTIGINNVAGSTGILAYGGNSPSGGIVNDGAINLTENYTPSDKVNGDGVVEAPFADTTLTGRYGIRVTGSSPFGASIDNAGSISVYGVNSYGVSIEAPVTGTVANAGTIAIVGDSDIGLNIAAPVTGAVTIEGEIGATGSTSSTTPNLATTAVNISGQIGTSGTPEPLDVYGAITTTGYSTSTRTSDNNELIKLQSTPTDIEQSGSALVVGGNVTGGVFLGAPPAGTTSTSTADADGDGLIDAAEGTATVTTYGQAPAMVVGAPGGNIAIGEFSTSPGVIANTATNVPQTPPANDYGVIIEGSVSGYGVYDGVPATALQLGATPASDGTASGTVNIAGGVRIVGSLNATSFVANATGMQVYAGATIPEIRNEGFIDSTVYSSTASTATTLAATPATAGGILIGAGANVPKLTNYGTISAAANGDYDLAKAVADASGSLSTVVNEGIISSVVTPATAGLTVPSTSTVALDLSANTSGVTLIQQVNANPIPIEVETTTSSSGTTSTTAVVGSTTAGATTTSNTVSTTTTVTTTSAGVTTTAISTTPTSPVIQGDVLLGNGNNTVQIMGGSLTGALSLGDGVDTLTIGGTDTAGNATSAIVDGPLLYSGSALTLNVNNGVLDVTNAAALKLSTLNIASQGTVYFAIDPVHNANTEFLTSGTANIASGAQLGVSLLSPLSQTTTYEVIRAGTLNNAVSDSALLTETPYFITGYATSNAAAGTVDVTLSVKTPQQMGLNPGQSAAFNGVIAGVTADPSVQAELYGQYTRSGFLNVYNQLLPEYAGGVFQLALAGSDAITRATSRTNQIENPAGTRGAWAEEVVYGVERPDTNATAYQGGGFGFIGGLETGGAGLGAFGLTGSFLAGGVTDPHAPGDNLSSLTEFEAGAYWQAEAGGFRADARLAGGYVRLTDRRQLYETDSTGTVTLERNASGASNGYSATAHFGAGYQFNFGPWYVRPQARAEYFRLTEGGYSEHGGGTSSGDGFDLTIAQRTGDQADAAASMVLGTSFGRGFVWRPELEVGYRNVFSGTAGDTVANFVDGQPFTLVPVPITGGGPLARFSMKGDTDFYELNFEAGAEARDRFAEGDVRLNIRVLF